MSKIQLLEYLIKDEFYSSNVSFEYSKPPNLIPECVMFIYIDNILGSFVYTIGFSKFLDFNNLDLLQSIIRKYEIDINFYCEGE